MTVFFSKVLYIYSTFVFNRKKNSNSFGTSEGWDNGYRHFLDIVLDATMDDELFQCKLICASCQHIGAHGLMPLPGNRNSSFLAQSQRHTTLKIMQLPEVLPQRTAALKVSCDVYSTLERRDNAENVGMPRS